MRARARRNSKRTQRATSSVDAPSPSAVYMPASRAKNEFATVLEEVLRGREVVITKHKAPKAVVVSMERFNALTTAATPNLGALTASFDSRLARMQTSDARTNMRNAFNASPAELAQAAVNAARSRR
jgi:prevent-host-death family protein